MSEVSDEIFQTEDYGYLLMEVHSVHRTLASFYLTVSVRMYASIRQNMGQNIACDFCDLSLATSFYSVFVFVKLFKQLLHSRFLLADQL